MPVPSMMHSVACVRMITKSSVSHCSHARTSSRSGHLAGFRRAQCDFLMPVINEHTMALSVGLGWSLHSCRCRIAALARFACGCDCSLS
jgi:hypothetical protein